MSRKKGKNKAIKINQLSLDGDFIKTWNSAMAVKNELGISNTTISACINGKVKNAGGYLWEYATEKEPN